MTNMTRHQHDTIAANRTEHYNGSSWTNRKGHHKAASVTTINVNSTADSIKFLSRIRAHAQHKTTKSPNLALRSGKVEKQKDGGFKKKVAFERTKTNTGHE